jgi:hypothetical protein
MYLNFPPPNSSKVTAKRFPPDHCLNFTFGHSIRVDTFIAKYQ